jgi:hypothetical protein
MHQPVTLHRFRSSFRDWAGERTPFPHDVCEAALAHIDGKPSAPIRAATCSSNEAGLWSPGPSSPRRRPRNRKPAARSCRYCGERDYKDGRDAG